MAAVAFGGIMMALTFVAAELGGILQVSVAHKQRHNPLVEPVPQIV